MIIEVEYTAPSTISKSFRMLTIKNMETPQKIKIDLSQAPWLECSEGNLVFDSKALFKKISSLVSPSGREEFVPLEVVICQKCGKVPRFFYEKAPDVPESLRSDCTF